RPRPACGPAPSPSPAASHARPEFAAGRGGAKPGHSVLPGSTRSEDTPIIDLKKQFPRLRVTLDESAESRTDPAMYQIAGRKGTVYVYGPSTLAVEVDYHPSARKALAEMGLACVQDGDHEATFTFTLEQAPAVFRIIRPHRLPGPDRLSDAHRAKLASAS